MIINKSGVQEALRSKRFTPFFQPIHNIMTGDCVGAELLARLPLQEPEYLLPEEFMLSFSDPDDLVMLTKTLLDKAENWVSRMSLPHGFMLTFNVTADMAGQAWLLEDCQRFLKNTDECVTLVVELTENLPLTCNGPEYQRNLALLKKSGVLIALDDFGTGCSSLHLLQQTEAQMIKLPWEFVSTVNDSRVSASIIDGITELARNLGISIIAEGVETAEQINLLAGKGVIFMQGFYYNPPLSEKEFIRYLG